MHGLTAIIHGHLALALGHLVGHPVQPLKKNAIKVALNGVVAGATFLRLREHETQISRHKSADVGRHQLGRVGGQALHTRDVQIDAGRVIYAVSKIRTRLLI